MKKIVTRKLAENSPKIIANPLLNQIYVARGVKDANELEYGLANILPFQDLLGVKEAVEVLTSALQNQERVLIVGDFDADGATSTALAMLALKAFGFQNVDYLIPNRFDFGYGLTPEIVKVAQTKNPNLIVTVDNGIASVDGVDAAAQSGIKVIITDHHLPPSELPRAAAIVNPSQNGCLFASKNLAGVGVIFYVLLALRAHLREIGWFKLKQIAEPNMAQFLDLVALGTIADLVSLDRNNRIFVAQGLERMRKGQCSLGIKSLLAICKRNYERTATTDLGFLVAPRINAAGRLEDMSMGVECLMTDNVERARSLAKELDRLNAERREIESDMQRQAVRVLDNIKLEQELPLGLCVFEEGWHQGVLGILASRLKDKLHRPVIAFAEAGNNQIKGSARSVAGVHVRDVISNIAAANPGLIAKFGGHAMAAGLSLDRENYAAFADYFAREVEKYMSSEDLKGIIYSDGELLAEYFNVATAELLLASGPWGHGFPEPVFNGVFALVNQRIVGEKHFKVTLRHAQTGQEIDGIYFNVDLNSWPNYRVANVHAVYRLGVNEYNGRKSLQLMLEHLQCI